MKETENYSQTYQNPGMQSRLIDLEQRQRLLKERLLIVGKNLISEKETNIQEMQELKKITMKLQEENKRLKNILENVTKQLQETPRKADFEILQRQLDLLRKD